MKFDQFLDDLTGDAAEDYAKRCGTTALYLRNHLRGATRVPRPSLLNKLWQESGGKLRRQDVLDHFFPKQNNSADAA